MSVNATPTEVGELVVTLRNLTTKVEQLVETIGRHGTVLFGPNGDEGMLVRFTRIESRLNVIYWVGSVVVGAIVVAAIGILVARAMGAA